MRLLLLALAVLVSLPQVIPAYGGGKKCWNNQGHCRKNCKADEAVKSACKNHQACCVSVKEGHRQIDGLSHMDKALKIAR
ncbi:PREDICTED: beta-defensin 118 [Ceratotherium simum simum]|uniref:Beta-defensin n=1 Tax=Ceratotherium simum simum TaxID=73337 RepID=A0ABM0I8F3_CERSS|nr:PREDICTED: beta-defensin 118 [Ceratotherium simum simum]